MAHSSNLDGFGPAQLLLNSDWTSGEQANQRVHFRGYFYTAENLLLGDSQALDYIFEIFKAPTQVELDECLAQLNGNWSIIFETSEQTVLVSDPCRTYPIFYTTIGDKTWVSDKASSLVEKIESPKIDQTQAQFYFRTGCTLSGSTLFKSVKDLGAGEYLRFLKNGSIVPKTYWTLPTYSEKDLRSKEILIQELGEIYKRTLIRLENYLNSFPNLPIFLPLSGGMDSRLLASELVSRGFRKRIHSYTYGKDIKSEEAQISKIVAKKLDLKWEFFEYPPNLWKKNRELIKSKIFDFNPEKALPYFVDYFAIQEISNRHSKGGIIIPGHLMDNLAGLTIPEYLKTNNSITFEKFYSHKFGFKEEARALLNLQVKGKNRLNRDETFRWKNKITAVVLNGIEMYREFGFQVTLPFTDRELVEFFYTLPLKHRIHRNLFRTFVVKKIYPNTHPELLQIPIAAGRTLDANYHMTSKKLKYKSLLKFYLRRAVPPKLLDLIERRKKIQNHPNVDYIGFYNLFEPGKLEDISEMKNEFGFKGVLKSNIYKHYYLEIMGLWTLNILREKWEKNERNI